MKAAKTPASAASAETAVVPMAAEGAAKEASSVAHVIFFTALSFVVSTQQQLPFALFVVNHCLLLLLCVVVVV